MIETIARAGVVNHVDGLFIETHFDPANAKSDGANMLHLDQLEGLLTNLTAIRKTILNFKKSCFNWGFKKFILRHLRNPVSMQIAV